MAEARKSCPKCKSEWMGNLSACPVCKTEAKAPDYVNHPPHYNSHPSGIECIQVTEHMGFNLGNVIKYVWRADLKSEGVFDLEKAEWYIKREIQRRLNLAKKEVNK